MAVRTIAIRNFRNHHTAEFQFGDGINVIWGDNGSGKTSVLEALYLLAYGRSFRTARLQELLRTGAESMLVEGDFRIADRQYKIKASQVEDGRKKYFINEQAVVGARQLIGLNPVVVLSPEEQSITKGPPARRRAYFDRVFSVVAPAYMSALAGFTRALRQRNAALDQVQHNRAPVTAVQAWDEALVEQGATIWRERQSLLSDFRVCLATAVKELADRDLQLAIIHTPQPPPDKQEYLDNIQTAITNDCRRGYTTIGPHRDQYEIEFNNADLRKFGSQGEHKISLVLIKMAEALFIRQYSGKTPTVLLDDLFAKLDFHRSDLVLSALGEDIQTIITSTDLIDLEKHGVDLTTPGSRTYHLEKRNGSKSAISN